MSRGANLSILGLYNNDPTVFDLMHFPEGFTADDIQATKDNILIECAELEVLYANPAVMKNIIGVWSYKELPYWQRVYNASKLEYNPIENYRRNETETIEDDRTEQHSGSDVNTAGGTDALARTGTETMAASGSDVTREGGSDELARTGTETNAASGSDTTSGESNTTENTTIDERVDHNISGYDSNTLVANTEDYTVAENDRTVNTDAENTTTYGKTDTTTIDTTDTTTYGKTETLQHGKTETNTLNTTDTTTYGKTETMQHGEKIEHDGTTERSVLAYGNIGVTTTQEMLTQELELAKIIEVIPIIIQSFKDRFCLMVY